MPVVMTEADAPELRKIDINRRAASHEGPARIVVQITPAELARAVALLPTPGLPRRITTFPTVGSAKVFRISSITPSRPTCGARPRVGMLDLARPAAAAGPPGTG